MKNLGRIEIAKIMFSGEGREIQQAQKFSKRNNSASAKTHQAQKFRQAQKFHQAQKSHQAQKFH